MLKILFMFFPIIEKWALKQAVGWIWPEEYCRLWVDSWSSVWINKNDPVVLYRGWSCRFFPVSLYRQSLLKALLHIPRFHSRVKYLCLHHVEHTELEEGIGFPGARIIHVSPLIGFWDLNLGPWKSNKCSEPLRLLNLYFLTTSNKVVFSLLA